MPLPSSPTPLLRLSKLRKNFGIVTAVREVDLEVYRGDFISIFGPNGAGKTTLLRMIAQLARPTGGELIFYPEGQEPGKDRIGYASHQSLLYSEMTALENLTFYSRLYALPHPQARIMELVRKMGLWEARHQLVRGYSRGMKQRLTLARALLHQPRLLLLDEPFAGLDQYATRVLIEMLEKLRAEERTILLITHHSREGLALCNRVIIQHLGRFVFQARREEVQEEAFDQLYFQVIGQGN